MERHKIIDDVSKIKKVFYFLSTIENIQGERGDGPIKFMLKKTVSLFNPFYRW